MTHLGESVSTADAVCPSLDLVGIDLNGQPAFATDQVMVMVGGAGAIEQLAVGRSDAVGVTGEQQIGQHTIDGGEPDG